MIGKKENGNLRQKEKIQEKEKLSIEWNGKMEK